MKSRGETLVFQDPTVIKCKPIDFTCDFPECEKRARFELIIEPVDSLLHPRKNRAEGRMMVCGKHKTAFGPVTEYAHVDIDLVEHSTDEAVLVVIDGVQRWIPFSVLDGESVAAVQEADRGSSSVKYVQVAVWFAEKKGLV